MQCVLNIRRNQNQWFWLSDFLWFLYLANNSWYGGIFFFLGMKASKPCLFMVFVNTLFFQPKYYDGDYQKMLRILNECKETGCTFLVGGRNVGGVFKVHSHLRGLCHFLTTHLSYITLYVSYWSQLFFNIRNFRFLTISKFQRS